MEYCEKSTLRQLIDTGKLHKNMEEVWRLFRELVEGLAHIHSRVCISACCKYINPQIQLIIGVKFYIVFLKQTNEA